MCIHTQEHVFTEFKWFRLYDVLIFASDFQMMCYSHQQVTLSVYIHTLDICILRIAKTLVYSFSQARYFRSCPLRWFGPQYRGKSGFSFGDILPNTFTSLAYGWRFGTPLEDSSRDSI